MSNKNRLLTGIMFMFLGILLGIPVYVLVTQLEPTPQPEPPTTYNMETRCNNNVLEVRLKENNEGFTKWFATKHVQCEVANEKPLDPKEALKVKLTTPGTCPAHCICPTTKQLDVCLVTRGMAYQDLEYYKNIAASKKGCTETAACLGLATSGQALLERCEMLLDRCLKP
jgi:hypothetical protein